MSYLFLFLFILPIVSAHAFVLSEQQATKIYLEKNLQLIASRYEIDLSKAEELTAGLYANPSVLIDTQLNPFSKSNWDQTNTGGPAQQDLLLNVPIDVNGKRRQAVRVARLATKVTEAQFQAVVREGIFSMLSNLYQLQKLIRTSELLIEKGQFLDRLVLSLEKRIGNPTRQPLIQSRVRLALADVNIEIERNKIDIITAENQLRVLLQFTNEESLRPAVSFKNPITEKFDVSSLVENAKQKRPDFRAIEILKQQLEGQSELDQRRIWNDIGFQVGITKQDRLNAKPGDMTRPSLPGATSWFLGVNIPLPFFDRNQGNILATKIRSNQTLVREKFMMESLTKQIETSIKKIEITSLNLSRYKTGQLNTSKLVRDAAFRQFGSGASTLLEFLDALDAYHLSIQKYIETEYDLSTEYLNLKLISGQEVSP